MERFLTADLHVGHANIIDFCDRPFSDVNHMNTVLVQRWQETVRDDDEVWVVGDLAMGRIEDSLAWAGQLTGRKFLVPGNHDRCWPGGKKDWEAWVSRYEEAGFEVVRHEPGETVVVDGVRLCHWPSSGDSHETDRFSAWRPASGPLLHGHIHDAWKVRNSQVNVGTDVWGYRPVAWDEAVALLGTADQ